MPVSRKTVKGRIKKSLKKTASMGISFKSKKHPKSGDIREAIQNVTSKTPGARKFSLSHNAFGEINKKANAKRKATGKVVAHSRGKKGKPKSKVSAHSRKSKSLGASSYDKGSVSIPKSLADHFTKSGQPKAKSVKHKAVLSFMSKHYPKKFVHKK